MKNERKMFGGGVLFIALFILWTCLILTVDVKPLGQNGTDIGLSTFNKWFHDLTGVHMTIYTMTDWLGLVAIFVCLIFAGVGVVQLVKRRSLIKVDKDIMILGIYYIVVISAYLLFEMIPINYRPILIDGRMESSYPSSTTLLILCVMPTLVEQANRRIENSIIKQIISVVTVLFSSYMVIGRLISGVHWFTDILGAVLLSIGLFCIYKGFVLHCFREK